MPQYPKLSAHADLLQGMLKCPKLPAHAAILQGMLKCPKLSAHAELLQGVLKYPKLPAHAELLQSLTKEALPAQWPFQIKDCPSSKKPRCRTKVLTLGWRSTSTKMPVSTASLRASALAEALVRASPKHTCVRTCAKSSIAPDRDSFRSIWIISISFLPALASVYWSLW